MIDNLKKPYIDNIQSVLKEKEALIYENDTLKFMIEQLKEELSILEENYFKQNIFLKWKNKKIFIKKKEDIIKQIDIKIKQLEENLTKTISIEKIEELKIKLQQLIECNNWASFKYITGIKENLSMLIKSSPKEFALTEQDCELAKQRLKYYRNDKIYQNISELVLIHKSNFAPVGNKLSSVFNNGITFPKTFTLGTHQKTFQVKLFRNTIHFAMNGEVSSHIYGNFDNRKYAIILPLDEDLMKQIKGFNVVDTFFLGSVDISKGYILCPVEEYNIVQANNSQTQVIPYVGKTVDGFADAFISILNYQKENVGMWSWADTYGNNRVQEIGDKYNLEYTVHSSSKQKDDDDRNQAINDTDKAFLFLLNEIKNNNVNPIDIVINMPEIYLNNFTNLGAANKNLFQKVNSSYGKRKEELFNILYTMISSEYFNFWAKLLKLQDSCYKTHEANSDIAAIIFIQKFHQYFPNITINDLQNYLNEYNDQLKQNKKAAI